MDPSSPYCIILEYMEHGTLDKLLVSLRSGPLPDWYIRYLKQCAIHQQTYAGFVAENLMEIIRQIVSAMVRDNKRTQYFNKAMCYIDQLTIHLMKCIT